MEIAGPSVAASGLAIDLADLCTLLHPACPRPSAARVPQPTTSHSPSTLVLDFRVLLGICSNPQTRRTQLYLSESHRVPAFAIFAIHRVHPYHIYTPCPLFSSLLISLRSHITYPSPPCHYSSTSSSLQLSFTFCSNIDKEGPLLFPYLDIYPDNLTTSTQVASIFILSHSITSSKTYHPPEPERVHIHQKQSQNTAQDKTSSTLNDLPSSPASPTFTNTSQWSFWS